MTGPFISLSVAWGTVQRGPVAIFMPIVRCTCGLRLLVPCKRPWLHLRPRPAGFYGALPACPPSTYGTPAREKLPCGRLRKNAHRRGACRPSRYRRHRSRAATIGSSVKKHGPADGEGSRPPAGAAGGGGGWAGPPPGRPGQCTPPAPRAPALSRAFAASRVAPPLSCPVPLLTKTSCAGNTRCTAPRWPG